MGQSAEADKITKAIRKFRRNRRRKRPGFQQPVLDGSWQEIRQALRLDGMSGDTFKAALPTVNKCEDIEVRQDSQSGRFVLTL